MYSGACEHHHMWRREFEAVDVAQRNSFCGFLEGQVSPDGGGSCIDLLRARCQSFAGEQKQETHFWVFKCLSAALKSLLLPCSPGDHLTPPPSPTTGKTDLDDLFVKSVDATVEIIQMF